VGRRGLEEDTLRGEERWGWEGERKDGRRVASDKKGCSGSKEWRRERMDALGGRRGREEGSS
jgi:hypothetical protein